MKTNKILMAMVLAAGFTACTSEELVESTQTNDLNNRKVLGDIEFVLGDGVDSRFAVENGKWKIEAGDAFGAALVDVPNGQKKENAYENYDLTNYIQTNYQYAKGEGDVFTTPARMVEGNYVFYAPYNAKHLARTPMEVAFPIVQTLDVNEDGEVDPVSTINNALKEGYPFFVDYKFLSAEDQETSLTINFKHLYAYPEVKFVNNSKEAITLDKFVVVLEGEEIPVKPTLNLVGDAAKGLLGKAAAADAEGGIVGNLFNLGTEKTEANATSTTALPWGAWVNYNVTEKNNVISSGSTYDLVNTDGAVTSHITIEIPEGLTVEAGDEVKFNIVLPAKNYSAMEVFAMVDAEEGYVFDAIGDQFIPGERYPWSDFVPSTGKLMAANKIGKAFTKTVKKTTELEECGDRVIAPVSVANNTELTSAIRNGEGILKVIVGEEVIYNDVVAEVLADTKTKVTNLIVLGDLNIAGTATATEQLVIGSDVEISGVATLKSGYATISMAEALKEVVVAKDATLTVTSEITKLTNNGTVNVAVKTVNNVVEQTAEIAEAINNNVMNIAGEGVTAAIKNYGTLNINKKSDNLVITNYWAADATAGTTEKYGTVNVAVDFTTPSLLGTWNATAGDLVVESATAADINKKVTISAGAKLKGADVTIKGGAELEVAGGLNVNVTISGTVAQPTATPAVALAVATLDLKSGAIVRGTILPASATTYKENLMTVEDNVAFSAAYSVNNNIKSRYSYTGNLPVAADETFKIPAQCNEFVLTGSINAVETGLSFASLADQIKWLTINGDIYVQNNEGALGRVVMSSNINTVKVTGDVETVDRKIDFGAAEVTIGGDLVVTGAFESNGWIRVAGEVDINNDVTLSNLYAADDIHVAPTKTLTVGTLGIEGSVDFEGQLKANNVTVYGTRALTILKGSNVDKNSGSNVVFGNSTTDKYYGDPTTYSAALTAGTVKNNGVVVNAAALYGKTEAVAWWTNYYVKTKNSENKYERTGYVTLLGAAPVDTNDDNTYDKTKYSFGTKTVTL